MGNARGANAQALAAFSTTGYGGVPLTGYRRLPFVSTTLGEVSDLIESDLLGQGREPQDASDGPSDDEGALVVPVDLRHIGFHLRALLGPAATPVAGVTATGGITFSDLPVDLSSVTINGTAVVFTSGAPTASQVKIASTLKDTVANLVMFLNASVDAGISVATYAASLGGPALTITHKTPGTAGNSFTLAKSTTPTPNATLSAATLAGGAASGAYTHVFSSGAQDLPDAAIEIGLPEVPKFGMNYGVLYNDLSIQAQRSGLLNATLNLIAQGEAQAKTTQAGTPVTDWVIERFSQFSGRVERLGVPVGKVQSATLRYSNNLEKDESIRPDGRIGGADGATPSVSLELVVRFDGWTLLDLANNRTPLDVVIGWAISPTKSLTFRLPRLRLPRAKQALDGPNGVRATFAGIGAKDPTLGKSLIATLINDVPSY